MTLPDQVTSLSLSKKLKELGVPQKSLFYYFWEKIYCRMEKRTLLDEDGWPTTCFEEKDLLSAFSVAELGELLPEKTCWRGYANYGGQWSLEFGDFKASAEKEADARALMLIYLLEHKLIIL